MMQINNTVRMIHFLPDEKVTNNFIDMLESVYPGESFYAVYGSSKQAKMTKIYGNIKYYVKNSLEMKEIISDLSRFQKVFLHSLDVGAGFDHIKHPYCIWIVWGADLYESCLCYKGYNLYKDVNNQFKIRASHSPIGKIPVWLYKVLVRVRDRKHFIETYNIMKNIKGMSSIDIEYSLFKSYFPELNILKYPFFSYYPIERQIGLSNMDKNCTGCNIWVGNSPALNGNHLEIFKMLKGYSEALKVYVPIAYGEKRLIDYVDKIGHEMLGGKFFPLNTFMPAENYFNLYLDANAFIFGHLRHCGFGSILMALYFGGKCFLFKQNPLFEYFKQKGCLIYSIDEDLNEMFALLPLDEKDREKNRRIVKQICSKTAIQNQMQIAFSEEIFN